MLDKISVRKRFHKKLDFWTINIAALNNFNSHLSFFFSFFRFFKFYNNKWTGLKLCFELMKNIIFIVNDSRISFDLNCANCFVIEIFFKNLFFLLFRKGKLLFLEYEKCYKLLYYVTNVLNCYFKQCLNVMFMILPFFFSKKKVIRH